MFSSVDFFKGHQSALLIAAIAPAVLLLFVIIAPIVLRYGSGSKRFSRARKALQQAQRALGRVRVGLVVFRKPRLGAIATVTQLIGLGAAERLLLLPAGRARTGQRTRFRAPRRRSCSRSTSLPWCR